MRLSKQERIGVLIILAVVIIGLGIFLFIVPAAQTIGTSLENRQNKENEYNAAVEKANQKGPLKEQILDAYKDGEHLADMFFSEMKSYEADAAFREFLAQCESNVLVTSLTVSEPGTATLSPSFPTESEVTYDLKQYANQGVEVEEAVANRLARISQLATALGTSQTIGASTVSFNVKAKNTEELLKFVDEINNYTKTENGVEIRKALMLTSGIGIEYMDVIQKYDDYIVEINEQAQAAGLAAIAAGIDGEFTYEIPERTEPEEPEEGEEPTIETTYVNCGMTLTFYSIERMQNPQAQLDAQDGGAAA